MGGGISQQVDRLGLVGARWLLAMTVLEGLKGVAAVLGSGPLGAALPLSGACHSGGSQQQALFERYQQVRGPAGGACAGFLSLCVVGSP